MVCFLPPSMEAKKSAQVSECPLLSSNHIIGLLSLSPRFSYIENASKLLPQILCVSKLFPFFNGKFSYSMTLITIQSRNANVYCNKFVGFQAKDRFNR